MRHIVSVKTIELVLSKMLRESKITKIRTYTGVGYIRKHDKESR